MTYRIKIVGLALASVMAFSAIAAAAASAELAPRWKVEGSFLGSGATRNFTSTLTGTANLEVPGLLTLQSTECSATGKIAGSAAKAPGAIKETVLTCSEITVPGAPACLVEPVITNNIAGELGWMETAGESNVLTLKPEAAGGNFVVLIIEECALEGEYPITGGTIGTLEPAATEVLEGTLRIGGADTTTTEHYFTGKTPTGGNRETMSTPGLLFGGRAAKISGTFDISLEPQEKVGVVAG